MFYIWVENYAIGFGLIITMGLTPTQLDTV